MKLDRARRIVAFVEVFGMGYDRLAEQLDCSEWEAQMKYVRAWAMCKVEDTRAIVGKLNELAPTFGMSATDLVAQFS